eukprot:scaffold6130_cov112-Isochrysis_galbana.AAC.5
MNGLARSVKTKTLAASAHFFPPRFSGSLQGESDRPIWSLRTCQSSRPSNHPTVPQPLVLHASTTASDCKPLSDYPIKIFSHASRSLRDCSVSQGLKHTWRRRVFLRASTSC